MIKTIKLCLLVLASSLPVTGYAQATDLLPDIIVRPSDLLDNEVVDTIVAGRMHLLLSNGTANIGDGALYLRGEVPVAGGAPDVYQRIYRTDSTFWERFVGHFTYHPAHDHIHFEDWSQYRLRQILPGDGVGSIVVQGDKVSFCLVDYRVYDTTLAGHTGSHFLGCDPTLQGISVGYIDIYEKMLPDQWIDVTDVPAGTYWLESEVDPLDSILELDETNNIARVKIDVCVNPLAVPSDTLYFTDALGFNDGSVRVDVIAVNSLPLRFLNIPFSWKGPMGLQFDSVTTAGTRTAFFERVEESASDPFNERLLYFLAASNVSDPEMALDPGAGPVLSLYFTIPAIPGDSTNPIELPTSGFYSPSFGSACEPYAPAFTSSGSVTIPPTCCLIMAGNVDGDMSNLIDIADLTYLVSFMFGGGLASPCSSEADINQDGTIDISDLTYMVNFMFGGGPAPPAC